MRQLRSFIAIVLISLWQPPQASSQPLLMYRWQPVPYASGYIGVIKSGSRRQRFLTSGLQVVLHEDIKLVALHPLNAKRWRTVLPTSTRRVKQVSWPIATKTQGPRSDSRGGQHLESNRQEAEYNPWPETQPSVKNLNQYGLSLGLGRESITAQALGSEFRAEALIADTSLHVLHQPDLSRWSFDGRVSAHYFDANFDQLQDGGESAVSSTRIFRWVAEGVGFYDLFYRNKSQLLALGLGLHAVRLPLLDFSSSEAALPRLESQTMVAPLVAIQYVWLARKNLYFGSRLAGQPGALSGQLRGTGYQADFFAGYRFSGHWGTMLTAQRSRYRYTVERTCGDLIDCKPRDSATDSASQIMLGLTYQPH